MKRDYPILIGACGWDHSGWQDTFYPADLPADWRLGYYANEFPLVLIRAEAWQGEMAAADVWLESSDDSFRFVCEIPLEATDDIPRWQARVSPLGDRLAGVLLQCGNENSEAMLAQWLDKWGGISAVCVDFGHRRVDSAITDMLRQRGTGWCWHGETEADGLMIGTLAIARIKSENCDPKVLRHLLETCLRAVDEHRQMVLLFEGTPPDVKVMRDAGMILDLL